MRKIIFIFIFTFVTLYGYTQVLATLEVNLKNNPDRYRDELSIPLKIDLDAITILPDSTIVLVEVAGKTKTPIPYQLEYNDHRIMNWIISPGKNGKRIFQLIKGTPYKNPDHIKAVADNGFLTISNANNNLLRYNYKTIYPPKGIDTVYRRSGFIHPLWSPRGQELTRINAPDHYHHWGLWNPWTHVLFEKDTVDFWNLASKQGTVRFANFVSTTNGDVFAGFKVLHQHVVFKKGGTEKVAINEVQSVKIYQLAANQNYYIADVTIQLNCATESPVLLLEYRYGGLGIRATQEWNRDNSEVITSEGKNRKESDGSTARWVMVQGATNGDHAGLVMMSYPANYNHPEPLRVWPEDTNKRGDVFLNFSPTKNMNWLLVPGKEYLLKYRLLVFNDKFSKEKAEEAWRHFAEAPAITVKLNKQ
ncbi:MAG TPA: PmoA family protein [Chitinophagaceae bacterium]|nr:PmoA family protein [Chitinophagaceae bacterium]